MTQSTDSAARCAAQFENGILSCEPECSLPVLGTIDANDIGSLLINNCPEAFLRERKKEVITPQFLKRLRNDPLRRKAVFFLCKTEGVFTSDDFNDELKRTPRDRKPATILGNFRNAAGLVVSVRPDAIDTGSGALFYQRAPERVVDWDKVREIDVIAEMFKGEHIPVNDDFAPDPAVEWLGSLGNQEL